MGATMSKFIFVTGGVVSSLGKGLASASIGNLLESRGLKITFLKQKKPTSKSSRNINSKHKFYHVSHECVYVTTRFNLQNFAKTFDYFKQFN